MAHAISNETAAAILVASLDHEVSKLAIRVHTEKDSGPESLYNIIAQLEATRSFTVHLFGPPPTVHLPVQTHACMDNSRCLVFRYSSLAVRLHEHL